VLSDITGTTGMAILRAIIAGERDPVALAQLRNPGCKSSEEKLVKAMEGAWQAPYLFVMGQALALYDFYTQQLAACDAEIARYYGVLKPRFESDVDCATLPASKPGSKSKNQPSFNARAELARVVGIDLVAVTGLSAASVQTSIAEIGADMAKFPTAKAFRLRVGVSAPQ
jgi:transposase